MHKLNISTVKNYNSYTANKSIPAVHKKDISYVLKLIFNKEKSNGLSYSELNIRGGRRKASVQDSKALRKGNISF